jgi:AraC family transcriptional regulator
LKVVVHPIPLNSGTSRSESALSFPIAPRQTSFNQAIEKAGHMQKERRLSAPGKNSATPSQSLGLSFSETRYPAGLRMPAHQHGPASFSFVFEGGYAETLGSREREGKPLASIFHPEGESHSVVFHQSDVRIFRVEFGDAWRRRMGDYLPAFDEPAESIGGLPAFLAMRLYGESRRRDQWSALAIDGLTLEIVAEFGRMTTLLKQARRPHWVEEVREILSSRFAETPSLSELAESVGVHPVHLAREFRKRFGCATGDYVRRLRIEQACAALTSSDAPITEIALAAGFYDQSHFSNAFKKITGMTPAAWREASLCPNRRSGR